MKKIMHLPAIFCIWLLTGCVSHAYYLNAFNANANPYQAIPLQSDSIRGATYVSGGFTAGGANQDWGDELLSLRASIHRSHTFGNFHLYYGGNITLGEYNVSSDNFDENASPYLSNNTIVAGTKYFGGYGFNGGFNALVPLRNGGEWRVIGLEGSAQNEFGDYLSFKKNLPDSAASIIDRNSWQGTVGITTEIIGKRRSGATFGYKLAVGTSVHSVYNFYDHSSSLPPYISNTFHFGKHNWLVYFQLNFGEYAGSFQFGVNYRLGKK